MDIAELVRQVFLILLGNSMCLVLLDRKYSLRKTLTIYGIATLAVIVLGVSILILFGRDILYSFYPIIINCTTLAVLFYLSRRKGIPVIFTMFTVVMIASLITFPAGYLVRTAKQSILIEMLIKLIISIPIIIFLYCFLRPSYLQMLTVIKKGWGYLCLIPGLFYALILPNIINFSPSISAENRKAFLTCILALLIVIVAYGVIFALFSRIIRETQLRDEQQLLKIQMQAMERHANMLKANEQKLQIYQHDLRHYIANIQILIESGNIEEALRVLDSLDDTLFRLK